MLEINNTTKQKICRRKAARLTAAILDFYHLEDKEVSLAVIGDKKMRSLNRDFRGIDKTTDVLSFPTAQIPESSDFDIKQSLGEIFINIDEAGRTDKYIELFGCRRARAYIFYFLFAHGLLHLVGYDDKTEKGRRTMIALGEKFMDRLFPKKLV